MAQTITEALAEIKTIDSRLGKKRQAILEHLMRQSGIIDPMEAEGGQIDFVARTRQSAQDLLNRKVELRRAIQRANDATDVTILGQTRSISDWLVWRREAAPQEKDFLNTLRSTIQNARNSANRSGIALVAPGDTANKREDLYVNLNERQLAEQIETLEETLGTLDGVLSLKNATVLVDV